MDQASGVLTDEQALAAVELFRPWQSDEAVIVGDIRRNNGMLYRAVQAHTTQADWTPDASPALWTQISVDEWPEWVQPTGAQDAYPLSAKVMHGGFRWVSSTANNVWEPGIYGWTQV